MLDWGINRKAYPSDVSDDEWAGERVGAGLDAREEFPPLAAYLNDASHDGWEVIGVTSDYILLRREIG